MVASQNLRTGCGSQSRAPVKLTHCLELSRIDAAAGLFYSPRMAKKTDGQPTSPARGVHAASTSPAQRAVQRDESRAPQVAARLSALLDTHVVYFGDNLEQLARLPDGPCRTGHYWGETKEKRAFEDRHESTNPPTICRYSQMN